MEQQTGPEGGVDLDRRRWLARSSVLLAAALPRSLLSATPASGDQNSSPAVAPEFAIRTITAGINVTYKGFERALDAALTFLGRAAPALQAAGYVVQTRRVVTQPCADYLGTLPVTGAVGIVEAMQARLGKDIGFGAGPSLRLDIEDANAIDRAVGLALRGVASSIVIGTASQGIHRRAIGYAAEAIRAIAAADPTRNFNFAAISNVGPGVPYFPAGYHGAAQPTFMLGTQSVDLLRRTLREHADPATRAQALLRGYADELQRLETTALQIEKDTGWTYAGIDTTPAPWAEASMGALIEELSGVPFGAPGTLAACRLLTDVIRAVPVRRTGYQGLFLPPMEDAVLAARAHEHYGLSTLLSCSAVCGTGVDAVAIPGDAGTAAIARVLDDVASLATRLDKPLTARLMPVPGKQAGESSGPIANLLPMKVLALE